MCFASVPVGVGLVDRTPVEAWMKTLYRWHVGEGSPIVLGKYRYIVIGRVVDRGLWFWPDDLSTTLMIDK